MSERERERESERERERVRERVCIVWGEEGEVQVRGECVCVV